jgi:hypothetical protein
VAHVTVKMPILTDNRTLYARRDDVRPYTVLMVCLFVFVITIDS